MRFGSKVNIVDIAEVCAALPDAL
ncbi:protein of unknown function [Hyphomicrobium sp. 1Nfss2.1]